MPLVCSQPTPDLTAAFQRRRPKARASCRRPPVWRVSQWRRGPCFMVFSPRPQPIRPAPSSAPSLSLRPTPFLESCERPSKARPAPIPRPRPPSPLATSARLAKPRLCPRSQQLLRVRCSSPCVSLSAGSVDKELVTDSSWSFFSPLSFFMKATSDHSVAKSEECPSAAPGPSRRASSPSPASSGPPTPRRPSFLEILTGPLCSFLPSRSWTRGRKHGRCCPRPRVCLSSRAPPPPRVTRGSEPCGQLGAVTLRSGSPVQPRARFEPCLPRGPRNVGWDLAKPDLGCQAGGQLVAVTRVPVGASQGGQQLGIVGRLFPCRFVPLAWRSVLPGLGVCH